MTDGRVASLIDPDLRAELFSLVKARLFESPELRPVASVEARWIVDEALKAPENGETARIHAQAMTSRRLNGEPLSRIFGTAEFYGLELAVNDATLDPRNDTEALVDLVLANLPDEPTRVVDLGTGTGAIALALISERPSWTAIGCDLADDAVQQAVVNANSLGLSERFEAAQSDWFSGLEGQEFDLIVSNPPYLNASEMDELDKSVQGFDPNLALFGGDDGLRDYRLIFQGARDHLSLNGTIAVEIGWKQKSSVTQIAAEAGFTLKEARQDLGKRDRALLFVKAD